METIPRLFPRRKNLKIMNPYCVSTLLPACFSASCLFDFHFQAHVLHSAGRVANIA